ncbi:MAG: hypothetical protein RR475_02455 [Clostridia bacterium]
MDKMIGYVFGSLASFENAIKNINKTLKRQTGFNLNVFLFMLLTVAWMFTDIKEVRNLRSEVEKLKNKKGD